MSRRLTAAEFIKAARKAHGRKYDYSQVQYRGRQRKIKIACPLHGAFWQRPKEHGEGQGCPECGHTKAINQLRLTTDEFIRRARKIHGRKYEYSKTVYADRHSKLKIKCRIHGIFEQEAGSHLSGRGCLDCGRVITEKARRLPIKEVINKIETAHPNISVMSCPTAVYRKAELRCMVCGTIWSASPANLVYSNGAPKCGCPGCPTSTSQGERIVAEFLKHANKPFLAEARIIPERKLYAFDFYLPGDNVLIEFHGRQHYRAIEWFGGKKAFRAGQRRDRFKTKWAAENGYELIVIPYWENVEEVLIKRLLRKAA